MNSQSILHKQQLKVRVFISLAKIIFTIFFQPRQHIALDNLRRSSLGPRFEGERGQRLVTESLNHLALTLYHCVARVFGLKSKFLKRSNPNKSSDLISFLDDLGVKVDSKLDLGNLIDEQRGLIFMSAHIGAWEELIHLGTILERKTFVLSRRMKIKVIQWLWDKSRRSFLPRMDQGQRAKLIINTLNQGGAIADVLDQHSPSKKAITCQFLGRSASTSSDLSRYALLSDSLIIPIFLLRDSNSITHNYCLHILDSIDPRSYLDQDLRRKECIEKLTQSSCDRISEIVTLYPEQWLWIHRRWKLD